MKDHKEQAEYYRIGLLTGLLSVSDVVAWADKEIEQSEKPLHVFLDLSSMEKANASYVHSKLREFPGEVDKFMTIRKLLGDMYIFLRFKPQYGKTIAWGLAQLFLECTEGEINDKLPDDLQPISSFDDYFEIGTKKGALKEFMRFLKPFAKRTDNVV